jgi:thiol-disulfide isomerase/thioredoxin
MGSCFSRLAARSRLALALLLLGAGEVPLDFETLAGEPVRVELGAADAALVVHFWATWCPECTEELPALDRAAARCSDGALRVVAVNVGDSRKAVEEFLAHTPLRLPVLRDPEGRVWRRVAGHGLPGNLFVTREARRTEVGPKGPEAWEGELADLGCAGTEQAPRPRVVPPGDRLK